MCYICATFPHPRRSSRGSEPTLRGVHGSVPVSGAWAPDSAGPVKPAGNWQLPGTFTGPCVPTGDGVRDPHGVPTAGRKRRRPAGGRVGRGLDVWAGRRSERFAPA